MNKKGFTLVELIIVVAIIGILAMVAVPGYIGQQKNATRAEAYANLQNLRLLEEQNFADSSAYVSGVYNATTTPTLPLSGFKPGTGFNFDYSVTNVAGVGLATPVPTPYKGTTAALTPATTPCFIATATGRAGTRVAGDVFAIDCNNNRNF